MWDVRLGVDRCICTALTARCENVLFTEANLGKFDSNLGKIHSISPKVSKEANLGKSDSRSWQNSLHFTKGLEGGQILANLTPNLGP